MKNVDPLKNYLKKHFPAHVVPHPPRQNVGLIVVIPAYLENNYLPATLKSLANCNNPGVEVEVVVVINASEQDPPEIVREQRNCELHIQEMAASNLPWWLHIHPLPAFGLRAKHFGAGLARKTGLDEAVRRFQLLGKPNGILACLDADSPVEPNYLTSLTEWFSNPLHRSAVVHYEHPLTGSEFNPEVYRAVTLYELHLRYYVQALRQTGFPYSFHTVGSTMIFRAETYARAGGMPRKQAGEDFYFIQKIIPMGGFGEIWGTTVMPSPRPSNRVIFGTGAAIQQHLNGTKKQGLTYALKSFDDLKALFSRIDDLHHLKPDSFESWTAKLPAAAGSFLLTTNFEQDVNRLRANCSTPANFRKQFFEVFNAFKVVKFLNYAHLNFYAHGEVAREAAALLSRLKIRVPDGAGPHKLLQLYRDYEKKA